MNREKEKVQSYADSSFSRSSFLLEHTVYISNLTQKVGKKNFFILSNPIHCRRIEKNTRRTAKKKLKKKEWNNGWSQVHATFYIFLPLLLSMFRPFFLYSFSS